MSLFSDYEGFLNRKIQPDIVKNDNDKSLIFSLFDGNSPTKLRLIMWNKNGIYKLYLHGAEVPSNYNDHGFAYEDDVRRIRDYIDRNPESILEVDGEGEVRTKASITNPFSINGGRSFLQQYIDARNRVLFLYNITQKRLNKLKNMTPTRSIDYFGNDLNYFNNDYSDFQPYVSNYSSYVSRSNGNLLPLVKDGIYPYYAECQLTKSNQKPRILVLGRDPRDMAGLDYIETTLGNNQQNCEKNKKLRNSTSYKTMIPVGKLFFPKKNEKQLYQLFGRICGFSYAFINVCPLDMKKTSFSKKGDYWKVFDSTKRILEKRINNLSPDCIIALAINGTENQNLDIAKSLFGVTITMSKNVEQFKIVVDGKTIPLFYTKYHPSYGKWNSCKQDLIQLFGKQFP